MAGFLVTMGVLFVGSWSITMLVRRALRFHARRKEARRQRRTYREIDATLGADGGVVVAQDLDPATMATWIAELRERGYAVWPQEHGFTAMPPSEQGQALVGR